MTKREFRASLTVAFSLEFYFLFLLYVSCRKPQDDDYMTKKELKLILVVVGSLQFLVHLFDCSM